MVSGHYRYLSRNKSSYTVFVFVPHMNLNISKSASICRRGRGVLNLYSKTRTSPLTGCREVRFRLTDSLHMFNFAYNDRPSSQTSACLTAKRLIPFYVLWVVIKTRSLTGYTLHTLLDLLDPPAFCLFKFTIRNTAGSVTLTCRDTESNKLVGRFWKFWKNNYNYWIFQAQQKKEDRRHVLTLLSNNWCGVSLWQY